MKSVAKNDDESVIASGGRDGRIYFYDVKRMPLSQPVGDFMFTQKNFSSGKKSQGATAKLKLPQVTGLAFMKLTLLTVIESYSDKISFLDMRKLSGTSKKNMLSGSVTNKFYADTFGETVKSSKGCSSISIN